jgi:hypothetical protein
MTDFAPSGSAAGVAIPGNRYLNRALLTLVVIAIISFTLFSAVQGFDFPAYPVITHAHAVVMGSWLILLAVQSVLGSTGRLGLHRPLGWAGVGLVTVAVITGVMVSFQTIALGRLPLVFEAGYFLTLGLTNMMLFTGFVSAAIVTRRNTPWHRRFMLASILVIFEPVLGRLLPFFVIPAIGGPDNLMVWLDENRAGFELFRMGVHLGIIGLVMLGDWLVTKRLHPVYLFALIAVIGLYAVANLIGGSAPVQAFAAGLAPQT